MTSIILEGADHLGKTTLATALAKIYDFPIEHTSRPAQGEDYFKRFTRSYRPSRIYDRFHLGGLVYGELAGLHPTSWRGPSDFILACRMLRWAGAQTIIVYALDEKWFRNHLESAPKAEMYDIDTIIRINRIYSWIATNGSGQLRECYDLALDVGNGHWPNVDALIKAGVLPRA